MKTKANNEISAMQKTYEALSGLEQEEQQRVLTWVIDKLKLPVSANSGLSPGLKDNVQAVSAALVHDETQLNPKVFMAWKRPANLMERIACLAYLVAYYRKTTTFKTIDIEDMNKEAALPKISSAIFKVRDATTQAQYLAQAGGGTKQISVRGEALVKALPDREKVALALETHPLTRRGTRRARKAK